ncbi:MAG: hypothetical protein Q8R07_04280 [Candidatus Uhrbacteria bacterium]|nr:hypothetical protein [Candidatus Uhrbacteria bacterium]
MGRLSTGDFFGPTLTAPQKYKILQFDIKYLQKMERKSLVGLLQDNEQAQAEYITRCQLLYAKAVEENQIGMAHAVSRDWAKVVGVQVDEPQRGGADLITLLTQASVAALDKRQGLKPQLVIEAQVIETVPAENSEEAEVTVLSSGS